MKNFIKNESGATAIEYALILVLLSAVIAGSLSALGVTLSGVFTDVSNGL